jgi:hypothetical protein
MKVELYTSDVVYYRIYENVKTEGWIDLDESFIREYMKTAEHLVRMNEFVEDQISKQYHERKLEF